jgi:hypothetical protein
VPTWRWEEVLETGQMTQKLRDKIQALSYIGSAGRLGRRGWAASRADGSHHSPDFDQDQNIRKEYI